MKTESEIAVRMNELRGTILVINEKLNEELKKKRGQRDYRYLKFLDKEYHLWDQALHELEWTVL